MDLAARLEHLPIFPLPSVQLFPCAVLPLHVFEPRYRELLRDCLAADRRFAVAALAEDDDADLAPGDRPRVRAVCGVGEIIAHEALADGRSNVLLHGVARARIVEELGGRGGYRLVRAVALADEVPVGFDEPGARGTLVALADELSHRLPAGGDTLRALARSHEAPGPLSDVLAAAVLTDPDERQRLLETLDVAARVELVSAALAAALSRFGHERHRAN